MWILTVKWENIPRKQMLSFLQEIWSSYRKKKKKKSWSTVKRKDNIWHFDDGCLCVREGGEEATGTDTRRGEEKGRVRTLVGVSVPVERWKEEAANLHVRSTKKDGGRRQKRQRTGRNDRWMWSDAGTNGRLSVEKEKGFHTFPPALSLSFHPAGLLRRREHLRRRAVVSCRPHRQDFWLHFLFTNWGEALRILYAHRWTVYRWTNPDQLLVQTAQAVFCFFSHGCN